MNENSAVLLSFDGPIARITFNRPTVLNAINEPLAEGFRCACHAIAERDNLRVVVINGAGRGFMAGGDLVAIAEGLDRRHSVVDEIMLPLHEGLQVLAAIEQPVIGSLHGPVAGAGLSVALACDLAIAAEDATFTLAYARIGASPDGSGSYHLPRLVGLRKALEIALLADTMDAAEALRLGLVNWVVPFAELATGTNALAARLAAGPTVAYGQIKRLMRESFDRNLASQLSAEHESFHVSMRSADFGEGVAAFRAKRPATFSGR